MILFFKTKIFTLYDNKTMELFYRNPLIMLIMFLRILHKSLEVDCHLIVHVNCFARICTTSSFTFATSY